MIEESALASADASPAEPALDSLGDSAVGERSPRAGLSPQVRHFLQACVGLVGLVLVFELVRFTGILPARSVPSTVEMFQALWGSFHDGSMGLALGYTTLAWALGLAVAAVIAIPVGVAVGLSQWADSASKVVVEVLRPIPVIALVPLAIVIFGLQIAMQVLLIAIACVWPLLLGARGGVRAVDPLQIDTARTFGLGSLAVVWRVVLPAALPSIVTALRVAASIGVVAAIGAELISGSPGVGDLLIDSQNAGHNDVVWACLIVAGFFGLAVNLIFSTVERAVASWQELSTEGRR